MRVFKFSFGTVTGLFHVPGSAQQALLCACVGDMIINKTTTAIDITQLYKSPVFFSKIPM